MRNLFSKAILLGSLVGMGAANFSEGRAETVTSFSKESDGALCQMSNGALLKLQVCAGNIIRVVYTNRTTIPSPQGLVVVKSSFDPGSWDATDNGTAIVVTTPQVSASVTKSNGAISFANASGTTVCSELAGGRTLTAVTKGGAPGFSGTLAFDSPANEGVYGFGNVQCATPAWNGSSWYDIPCPENSGALNLRGVNIDMRQVNWYDVIPFFMTTRGYGVLLNFCCHATKTSPLNFTADFLLNDSWDYYFIYGPQFDTIISGYRFLTGPAPMLSKWAYGFWQCKNRYMSSNELTTTVSNFRSRGIPLDCIVQDWQWWAGGNSGWGSFQWDTVNYPNPAQLLTTLHSNNCHFAISVWESFAPQAPTYPDIQPYLMNCSGTGGTALDIFDTTGARKLWGYMNNALFRIGVDAWWMDATEPECPELTGFNTDLGMVDLYSNAYSLASSKNVYQQQRAVSTDKRVVNLTRSFYAGQQRYGTIYWNGDLNADSINCVKMTVAGGINSCMAGNAYWCSDIGGFQNNCSPGIASCEEIMTRWFQAGTFFPIFRVHGTRPTEIYNYSAQTQQICTEFSKVRYRLMPYIYSLAWKVTNENYTMTRALPFDFPGDTAVRNIANQFMFGPALLINPVTVAGAVSRSVYLPAGTWYDFWTGAPNANTVGRTITASSPIQTIPVYARAGAIIPMGPRIQYANQKQPDTIELRVYPGADGSFNLYEDEGDNYNYESGSFATIPISYNNTSGVVTIGNRMGTFPGMLTNRIFNIVFVSSGHGMADSITPNPDCVVSYNGSNVNTCALPPPSLPLPWSTQDIGAVNPAGSANWAADSFTVKGSGADIWGSTDAFQFVSQSLTGDATVVARVASQSNSNGWAKSGIMFREALTAGAKHVTVVVTPSNGVNLQYRASTGGTSTTVAAGTGITAPIWLKLVHSGSTFTAYRSTDGATWTQAATLTQTMASPLYAGLCVCSHLAGTLCTTVLKNVSATVTAPNNAPTIATAAKATPNPVTASTTVLSVLGADDNSEANLTYTWATTGTPPAAVTFSANGTNAAKNSTATFTKAGSYNFQVTVKDQGNLTVTSAITVTVNQTPTSIIVSPASATVNTSATQQFSATEGDQFGTNLTTQPVFTWSVSGGGTINASGLFTAGTTAGGPNTITAKSGSLSGAASVMVSASMPVYQLNSGGSAASPFIADQYYTGGTAASTTSAITTTGVTNPAPQAVYQTERYGTFSYTLSGLVAAAQYTVRLHLAEIYFTSSGQRTFNVVINGTTVLTNYDIYAATGARYKAIVREFTATADGQGRIVINFNSVINNAKSSGIEIIRK